MMFSTRSWMGLCFVRSWFLPDSLPAAGVASVAILVLLGCGDKAADADKAPPRKAVVEKGDIRDYLSVPGVLEARNQVVLKSEVSGQIAAVRIKEGDEVAAGDTLLLIDAVQVRNRMNQLSLNLDRSRIQVAQAERGVADGKELVKIGGMAPQKLQDLEWALELEKIRLKENRLALIETEIQLSKTAVTAPFPGTIIELPVKEGEVIVAGTASVGGGTSLGRLANLRDLTVTVGVSELDYPQMREGQQALVSTESRPDEKLPGRVEFISKIAKEVSGRSVRSFDVRIAMDSITTSLAPGINVLVEFLVLDVKDVPTLPYDLVYSENKGGKFQRFVWKTSGGEPQRVDVRTGRTNFDRIEVRSGLEVGDTVVERKDQASGGGREGGPQRRQRGVMP